MKVETITVMERKNLGNYEHVEISASARVEEGEDAYSSLLALKTVVHAALEGKAATVSAPTVKVEEVKQEVVEEVSTSVVKEKKTRAKKTAEAPVKDELSEVEPEGSLPELPNEIKGPPSIPYNRDLDTHRQLLSSFLNSKHPSWKTTQGVKEFSMSLVGKPFLNADGEVIESFAKLVGDFFNA